MLSHACRTKMSSAIRNLYAVLLVFWSPSNPIALFNTYFQHIYDDVAYLRSDDPEHETVLKRAAALEQRTKPLSGISRLICDFRFFEPEPDIIAEVHTLRSNGGEHCTNQIQCMILRPCDSGLQSKWLHCCPRSARYSMKSSSAYRILHHVLFHGYSKSYRKELLVQHNFKSHSIEWLSYYCRCFERDLGIPTRRWKNVSFNFQGPIKAPRNTYMQTYGTL